MIVYRIVKDRARTNDLSGTGAFKVGGRWNSIGTYMLYTSQTASLALLENLVHVDQLNMPPNMFIMTIDFDEAAGVYEPPLSLYPKDWKKPGLIEAQQMGDRWMKEAKYLAIKVRSVVNEQEFNYLLNPAYPNFNKLAELVVVHPLDIDSRLK